MAESWEVRRVLDEGDAAALRELIRLDPGLVERRFSWGEGCAIGACQPLSYLAQARFNGYVRHKRSGELARALIQAGAPVEGAPGDGETPLITAVSYGEPAVTRALLEAGANLAATGYAVAGGTPLQHAVEFGARECVDLLVAAGARAGSLSEAAGVGDLDAMLEGCADSRERRLALRAAAVCERIQVIDELLAAGVPIDGLVRGGTALHWAAWEAKAGAARHLVMRGASPFVRDPEHGSTPLEWARYRERQCAFAHPGAHAEVIAYLSSLQACAAGVQTLSGTT